MEECERPIPEVGRPNWLQGRWRRLSQRPRLGGHDGCAESCQQPRQARQGHVFTSPAAAEQLQICISVTCRLSAGQSTASSRPRLFLIKRMSFLPRSCGEGDRIRRECQCGGGRRQHSPALCGLRGLAGRRAAVAKSGCQGQWLAYPHCAQRCHNCFWTIRGLCAGECQQQCWRPAISLGQKHGPSACHGLSCRGEEAWPAARVA